MEFIRRWSRARKVHLALRRLRLATSGATPEVRSSALQALESLGPDALPSLRNAWKPKDIKRLRAAARGLGMLGTLAVPDLRSLMQAATLAARDEAIRALIDVLPRSFHALIDARQWAEDMAETIDSAFESPAPDWLPEIQATLSCEEAGARRLAARCLRHLGGLAASALSSLLSDDDPEIRREAALGLIALPALGGCAPEAVGRILPFYSADPETAGSLIEAGLETENPAFLPPLRAALAGDDPGARHHALSCLGKLGTVAGPDLASLSSDPDLNFRLEAARHLDALPILEEGVLEAISRALESYSLDDETAQLLIGTLARRACVSDQEVRWVTERPFEAAPTGLEESLRMLDGDLVARTGALLSLAEAGSIVHPLLLERLARFVEDRDEEGIRIAADILREAGGHAVRAYDPVFSGMPRAGSYSWSWKSPWVI